MNKSAIFTCLLSSFCMLLFGQGLNFRKLTSAEGLSHNTVFAIAQDDTGFMWFGTREGLNQFDGNQIKSYYISMSKLGKSTNHINALQFYRSQLYVGTKEGLYVYDQTQDSFTVLELPGMPNITFLLEDNGVIYAGTNIGLFRISEQVSRISGAVHVRAMCVLPDNRFLLALDNKLIIIDHNGQIERSFGKDVFAPISADDFIVYQIHRDPKGRIWLGTSYGIYRYDDHHQRLTKLNFAIHESMENRTVRSITSDQKDQLFIGTEDGLYVHHVFTGLTYNYQQSFHREPNKLNDQAIYSTFISKDGVVWLGTYFGGINYTTIEEGGFKKILPSDLQNGLSGKAVSQLMEDSLHRVWIATEDGGISIYDPTTESFEYINKESKPFFLNSNNVHTIHNDGAGNIWVGTFLGGLHRFNIKNKTTTIYKKSPSDPHSLSNNQVYTVYRDSRGILWIGTQQGLNCFDYKTDRFNLFEPKVLGDKFIYDMIEDKNGDLWFCSRQHGIYRYNLKTKTFKHYTNQGKNAPLLSNQIVSVYKDRQERLWFGTLDGGACVYNIEKDSFQHYTAENGLANNNVYGILEDKTGMVWLSTNLGISKCDPRTGKIINYDRQHGLSSNQFNFKSFLKASDGTFYFGSIDGLSYFDPLKTGMSSSAQPLVFTDFQLFNKTVQPDKSSAVLKEQIVYAKEINLLYNQNVFTISYNAIDYVLSGSTKYAYYLEGFENQWNYVGNKTSATYTNLDPGQYVFHVRTLDDGGELSPMEAKISIKVSPPFYKSNLAYIFYTFLLVGIIWMYTRFVRFLHQKRAEIRLAHMEKEKMEALSQYRINFFTFISHEFKTPLTLILACIDKFISEKEIDHSEQTDLLHIRRNASKLFRLIHQLAEFRKIEDSKFAVFFSKADVVVFVQQIIDSFEILTQSKNLAITFSANVDHLEVFFDADKLEKILSNILSNAIKHTDEGSIAVVMAIQDNNKTIDFSVSDTGTGMSATDLHHIFDPFYRSLEHKDIAGTGIGMALVASLVNSLHGKIDASSVPGKGTTISVHLPIYDRLDEQQTGNNNQAVVKLPVSEMPIASHVSANISSEKYTLLLVEDNKELLNFLSEHFQEAYRIIKARDGAAAWDKINKTPPDVIISDVNMPKTDGLELCLKLKQHPMLDHIPIILLSETDEDIYRINGLVVGADAYIGKPFNLKELEFLVSNMIDSRIKLKEHIVELGTLMSSNVANNNQNQDFLIRLNATLEKFYTDPGLSIEDIAAEMCISRTSLHLNLKSILHKSASEVLNEYRLKKALVMLESDMPITEIAYRCGYRELNYFSRVFKKFYQLSPQKYKESHFKMINISS
ncbi:hybrid sensor histidine kinase/response regulator transcription factor [Sphingobacterium corticibacterium]|uniref:histidine kinase n=1 Tax=Sphingobacterium corticibacterium TaxID=2484746 RepID=A0A4V2DBK7_9SPHI|nr:hybrid sensor histidine kinase/response regulator transcription factor [Sphingobacterium corticibacterium]RZF58328.1 hybrid sensor histidine kinase/response regulator [Sphingobacterium corticibacterium]